MLKITFVYPDYENIGIEYLMAICLQNHHDVDYVYYQAEDNYLGRKIKNIAFYKIAERIASRKPDIVAFSCVTDNYQYQLNCAKALKKIMPNVVTIFGGIHPTAVPEKVLQNVEVDCIAIGEAEVSLSNFLKMCDKNGKFAFSDTSIDGIVFKKDGKYVGKFIEGPLPELNTLPFPHKTPFFSILKYSSHEYRIMTSRGCPYSCSYCFNSYFHKIRGKILIRQREVNNVIDELAWAKEHYPIKQILFVDDSFTTNKEWVIEFCNRYKKEIGKPFACVANPMYVNREVVEALSMAGCINMQIGIQSFSEELCVNILNRKSNNKKIVQAIKDLKEFGIMVQVDHMLGIPGDTLKLEEENILFYNKHRPDLIVPMWLTYYPKTSIVEAVRKQALLSEEEIDSIEEGRKITEGSFFNGGSSKNPKPYYGICVLLNYLPILPRWMVNFLIRSGLYNILKFNNYFIVIALPRVVQSIFNKKDFRGRSHIIRFIDKIFFQKIQKAHNCSNC